MTFRNLVSRRSNPGPPQPDQRQAVESQLARCRRTGSAASLLVARVGDGALPTSQVEQRLRLSDAWMWTSRHELALLCDAQSLDRGGIERRLREATDGSLLCGWAAFPDNGLDLDDLLVSARRSAIVVASDAAARRSPVTDRAAFHESA